MMEYDNASKGASGNERGWESESGDENESESEYENESASTVVGESDNGMHMRM